MIYAEDIDGNSIHIDDAVKGNTYYFRYEDKEYEIIVAHGDKYRKHYKTKRGEDIDVNIIFHKDCQKYLKEKKTVQVDNLTIICDKVLLEAEAARYIKAKIPDYSMRPDCLFLDSDGEIMCIVEVNVTHAKDDKDIEKINQYQIPTIELTYGKQKDNYQQPIRTEWLYFREEESCEIEIRKRIRAGNISIQKASLSYNKTREYIRTFNARVRPSRTIEQLTEQIEFVTNRIRFIDACIQKTLV
jgi:hypothetical protein